MARIASQIFKDCRNCAQTFRVRPVDAETRLYCSRLCQHTYERDHGREATVVAPVEIACRTCGKAFFFKPGLLSEYRKRYGKDPMYCSRPCSAIGRRADTEARSKFTCLQCGKVNPMKRYEGTGRTVYYREQKFCNPQCKAEYQRKIALDRFNVGNYSRHIKRGGYVWINVPSLVTGKKHEMLEHRWVMTQNLGRELLLGETVHHVNGDRTDNRIENLELFSNRHGPGQRVVDKVAFAIDILRLYPDFALKAGVKLVDVETGEH